MEFSSDALLTVAFTAAFTAWAGVVAYGVRGIRGDLKEIANKLERESERLNSYIVQTESRLSVLEDRIRNHLE